ncbi:uncharacterized protein RJT20DRAFT_130363 [Scheffersomyces xylosifermentans]|uniref:uncharacterized protein n=1 Tax=Scheffersomyces xylosifermentans TaxID=1304137 RepID=UPI00315D9A6B
MMIYYTPVMFLLFILSFCPNALCFLLVCYCGNPWTSFAAFCQVWLSYFVWLY